MLFECKRCQGIYVVLLSLLSVAALSWLFGHSAPSTAMTYASLTQPEPFTSEYYAAVNERFGVGFSTGITITVNGTVRPVQISDYDIEQLHIGWYADWRTRLEPLLPAGLRYVQIVLVRASLYPTNTLNLTTTVAANPGSLWLIGNEPDCIWQDNSLPEEYAVVYHELYTFIKGRDPTARIAIGGIVQPTPLRLEYLDRVLEAYQSLYGEKMPVDVWNIHNMILREERGSWGCDIPPGIDADQGMLYEVQDNDNIEIFKQHIVAFRQWMEEKGERNKPLIVSEYGVLMPEAYGFDYPRVKNFMYATFDYFITATHESLGYPADGNRLVQRWAWYSLSDPAFEGWPSWNHLFDPDTTSITSLGLDFGSYTDPLTTPFPGSVDLQLVAIRHTRPVTGATDLLTTTVTAEIHNGGASDAHNIVVQFERGDGPAGEVNIPVLAAGGSESASVIWRNLAPGLYQVSARVDSDTLIVECDYTNNSLSIAMVVGGHEVFLPLIGRNGAR